MFKNRPRESLLLIDATIIFRNFEGKEGKYNAQGERSFCVLLDDDNLARQLESDGWNVKYLKAREEGDVPQPYIPVSVSYRKIPPKVALVTRRGKSILEEDMIELLDVVEIETVDVNINPSHWSVNGSSGIKAYLKSIYMTQREDPLDLRYAHIPEIGAAPSRMELESAESFVSPEYDFEGEVVDIPQRELGR